MFIAIVGTRSSGKKTVHDFLVNSKSFTSVGISENQFDGADSPLVKSFVNLEAMSALSDQDRSRHSFLLLDSDQTPLSSPAPFNTSHNSQSVTTSSANELLDIATRNWQTNFVTLDLNTRDIIEIFVKRPFFIVISVDGPLWRRYRRSDQTGSFEQFALENDRLTFGPLRALRDIIQIEIINDHDTIHQFHDALEKEDLLNPFHLRPDWDSYFMTLASLASKRSNCMKRRVGAILVRENRIVATGYNGTPRGVRNCAEGGCSRCNGAAAQGEECVCLHAEENALLEAGRERVGNGAVLYCNTCPCLRCTIKIVQTGVKEVVYNLAYKVDAASSALFDEAGIKLRRLAFDPLSKRYSSSNGTEGTVSESTTSLQSSNSS